MATGVLSFLRHSSSPGFGAAGLSSGLFTIDAERSGNHGHSQFAVQFHAHRFGQSLPRDMVERGDALRGVGRRGTAVPASGFLLAVLSKARQKHCAQAHSFSNARFR